MVRKRATRTGKLPTPVLSGSGSRVYLSPTSWSTPVSFTRLKHFWPVLCKWQGCWRGCSPDVSFVTSRIKWLWLDSETLPADYREMQFLAAIGAMPLPAPVLYLKLVHITGSALYSVALAVNSGGHRYPGRTR